MNLKFFTFVLATSVSLVFGGPACVLELVNKTPYDMVKTQYIRHQVCNAKKEPDFLHGIFNLNFKQSNSASSYFWKAEPI